MGGTLCFSFALLWLGILCTCMRQFRPYISQAARHCQRQYRLVKDEFEILVIGQWAVHRCTQDLLLKYLDLSFVFYFSIEPQLTSLHWFLCLRDFFVFPLKGCLKGRGVEGAVSLFLFYRLRRCLGEGNQRIQVHPRLCFQSQVQLIFMLLIGSFPPFIYSENLVELFLSSRHLKAVLQ